MTAMIAAAITTTWRNNRFQGAVRVEPCSIEKRRERWAHYTDEAKADAMAAGDLSGQPWHSDLR